MAALLTTVREITTTTTVKLVDAMVAASGLTSAMLLLQVFDFDTFNLFAGSPMLASGIIFFAAPEPPPAGTFILGTLGAFAVGVAMHTLSAAAGVSDSPGAQCFAAGLLLFWFKLSGSFFVPTVGLAAHLTQLAAQARPAGVLAGCACIAYIAIARRGSVCLPFRPIGYLLVPWAVGHAALYGAATVVARIRQRVRLALIPDWKAQLLGGTGADASARAAKLAATFQRFDTSGDGFLDSMELKLALRSITGEDLSVDDCERIIRTMDTDGDGVIDFHEFRMAISER